jgi:hypothetical protein
MNSVLFYRRKGNRRGEGSSRTKKENVSHSVYLVCGTGMWNGRPRERNNSRK